MTAKHTPGPWIADEVTGCVYGPDGKPIMSAAENALGDFDGSGWANALLIAAAPDMLEALRGMVNDCWARSGVGLGDHEADCERCRPARNAISRTEVRHGA